MDQGRLGQVERPGQVDVDDLAPVLVAHLEHRPVGGDAGVVDQDVEPAVLLDHLGDAATAVLGRADVAPVHRQAPVGEGVGEGPGELLGGLLVAAVAGGDVGALGRQAAADRRSDAPGPAGHER